MKIDNIEKLRKQDIKTKLLPTLKDRNPKKSNVEHMKQAVREYLKAQIVTQHFFMINFKKKFINQNYYLKIKKLQKE